MSRTSRRFLCAFTARLTRAMSYSLMLRSGGVTCREGVGLPACRGDHHDHVASVLLRRGLDDAVLADVLGELLEQVEAELRLRLLTPTEHDGDLDLVAALEEAGDMALLGVVVVSIDLRPELHLFDHGVRLVAPRLTGLLGVLVLPLAVVHELAHRRPVPRGDLHKVEVGLLGKADSVLDADDAHLLTVRADEPYLGHTDAVVDARFSADVSSKVCLAADTTKGLRAVREDPDPRRTPKRRLL